MGAEARRLFKDAQHMLDQMIDQNWITAQASIGLFPAHRVGDDIEVFASEKREHKIKTLHFLRQQRKKASGQSNLCLADFIAPKGYNPDYIGAFALTTGVGMEQWITKFEAAHDDYNAILVKALADRLVEAFAEYMHAKVRREFWGYGRENGLSNSDLIAEKYQGIRPAPGYPACPEHTEKKSLFELLQVDDHIQITLTEHFAMHPAAAVSGWYFSHPQSKYFGIGQIGKDQVEDYAQRKSMTLKEAERWMAPILNYEP